MDEELSRLHNHLMFQVKDKINGGKTCKGILVVKGIQHNRDGNYSVAKITTISSILIVMDFDNLLLEQLYVNITNLLDDSLE